MNSIFTRRSVRDFLAKPVEDEKIEKILRAGMQAPSAANGQPWEFIVVRGQENLQTLSKFSRYASSLAKADAGIVVLGNIKRTPIPEYLQQDLGAVTQNIMIEATELGLGTCWFGTMPDSDRMEFIQKLYGLEKYIMPYCVLSVGYPAKENANHFTDRFDSGRITYIK